MTTPLGERPDPGADVAAALEQHGHRLFVVPDPHTQRLYRVRRTSGGTVAFELRDGGHWMWAVYDSDQVTVEPRAVGACSGGVDELAGILAHWIDEPDRVTGIERRPSAVCEREDHRLCDGLVPALSGPPRVCGCDCHQDADSVHAVRRALDRHGVPPNTITTRPDGLYAIERVYGGTLVIGPERGRDGGLDGWTWTAYDDQGDELFTDGTEWPIHDAAWKLSSAVLAPHTVGYDPEDP